MRSLGAVERAASTPSKPLKALWKVSVCTESSLMPGGLGHEIKANSYKVGTEKAYHHLNRALDYFNAALSHKHHNAKAILARAKVLIQLATNYQPPRTATASLQDAVKTLRKVIELAPRSVSARETLAQACALLSNILLENDDTADDEQKNWEGQIGSLAREALQNLEDVAGDKMDRMRSMKQAEAQQQAPAMAETFLALSSAALAVSSLATDLPTVDAHVELAEQALDQASNMATVAASARVKSSSSSTNLITRVQLASGQSSLERLRHTFLLGVELDEDDFRSLMSDMSHLATECRERAAKLKGSKAAAASTLAWEAVRQLGDARVLYASLLRLVWRKRQPATTRASINRGSRQMSRVSHNSSTIQEEDEDDKKDVDESSGDVLDALPVLSKEPTTPMREHRDIPSSPHDPRRFSTQDVRRDSARGSRKGSSLMAMPEGQEVSNFSPSEPRFSVVSSNRRGSWLPESSPGPRRRRLSSMTQPLVHIDGTTTAWDRKASVISLASEDEAAGLVPSSALAFSAWGLLEGAIKQYKLGLTLLSSSDLPLTHLARAKAETLASIAYTSLFMASLSRRVAEAHEKRTSLLVTAEVYSTWSAREVGWSFLIEGTKEAANADRRTNSWRADESGKRAVMLLLRTWWHRAVTTDTIDTDTKAAAKDAVEVVVRRMRDREGVKDGDVVRFTNWLTRQEGEFDPAEALFWRSVSRILRGGAGFVMS